MKWFQLMHPAYYSPDDLGGGGGSGDPESNKNGGSGATPTIDWSKVDPASIPADLVKKTGAYTTVLDESVKRRQANSELKKELDNLSSKLNPEDKPADTPKTNANTPDSINPDLASFFEKLTQSIDAVNQRLDKQDTETLSDWRKNAAEKYGIKSEFVRDALTGKSQAEVFANAEKVATDLGIALPQNSQNVGNPNNQNNAAFRARVHGYMDGSSSNDPYDPSFQKNAGGGVIEN